METTIRVSFRGDHNADKLGVFSLCFIDDKNMEHKVDLKFNFKPLWEFAKDTQSSAFDFLILSMIIYNVDRMLSRKLFSVDGWRRQISLVDIPVINEKIMNSAKDEFNHAVSFLTGDDWNISFTQANAYNYSPIPSKEYSVEDYETVALFSGGLDSLIGFVDIVSSLSENKKELLISHIELGKEGGDQNRILNSCKLPENNFFTDKYEQLQVNAGLISRSYQNKMPTESTFRSRSLLFFAMGIYAAHHISDEMPLIVPENGTISINIPLNKSRRSSCSTRTTHPTFINRIEKALNKIGIHNRFNNPYRLKTKADMMEECFADPKKKKILTELYKHSCSCAKRSHNRWWDKCGKEISANHINHCGMCLPCIYRRVALDKVGLDIADLLGTDIFNGVSFQLNNMEQKRSRDFRTLLHFIKTRFNERTFRQELLINGVDNIRDLEDYTNLAIHSYQQVVDWVKKNGNTEIRYKARI